MNKIWNVKEYDEEKVQEYTKKLNISKILAKMLINQNVSIDETNYFIDSDIKNLEDPYNIKDMDKFIDVVSYYLDNNKKIYIYGDYDADGITSTAILYKFLTTISDNIYYYIPNRLTDGYGVSKKGIDIINKNSCDLIITVDCGITSMEEVEYANSLGMKVCITDHHECLEVLPKAEVVINAKRKDNTNSYKEYSGVGVIFKCITALSEKYGSKDYLKYLDIVALGTVADIVPLQDQNRILAKNGILEFNKTKNVGLKTLMEVNNITTVNAEVISFNIAPKINACGRLGNPLIALELLLCEDKNIAKKLVENINNQNKKRQQVESDTYELCIKNIKDDKFSICEFGKEFHSGVIGIVASKLCNTYNKPVVLFSEEDGEIRGSGRSIQGISIYEILKKCEKHLIQFGGHELAAGLTIDKDKIEDFKIDFEKYVKEEVDKNDNNKVFNIVAEIGKDDLNMNLLKDLYLMKPFGQSNKKPLFIYKKLKVHSISTIKDNKHLKITLKDDNILITSFAFFMGNRRDEIKLGDYINVIGYVNLNKYMNNNAIQIILEDFRKI